MNYSYKKFLFLKRLEGHDFEATIQSGSMEPWLHMGDKIIGKKCNPEDLKPFDIILYWRKNILICHIFLRIEDNFLITKPLRGKNVDPPIHIEHLLGVITKPKFGFFQKIILKFINKNI